MAYLSYAQLRAYAQAAGAPDPDTAAAIALAETGGTGNTHAHNGIPPDNSYGPWQINMIGSMGPDRRKKLGITSNDQLYDPAVNARAMMMVSNNGTDFSPWTTYKDGAYKAYLKKSPTGTGTASDANAVNANSITDIPGEIVGGVKSTADVVVSAANWIVNPSNWLRVLYVMAGAGIVLVGLDLLVQNQILGKAAKALGGDSGGSTAKSAATIGKAIFSPGGKASAAKKATAPVKKAAPAAKKAAPAVKKTTSAPAKKAVPAAPASGATNQGA